MVFVLSGVDTTVDAEAKLAGSWHSRVYRPAQSAATELAGWQWVNLNFRPLMTAICKNTPPGR